MYELVNTSLPNGLIPGTHGFAAVAMTKGLPDSLRTRLETYCAYSHRTSAHDAAYFTENPVNWFHVTLPQGEHVMGRVAPADFDYTGRTNRLARLLVFSKNEMPAIGGASVLKKECARLSEAWSGEARWLEADKLTAGRLRLESLQTNCDAPSWRAMFGNVEGLNLARGFARLLAKNLSTTGRTIYFKTSTAYDVDGTRLLALFSDLIDLLPVVDRRNVTFSTYPVALPQGTLCHLRGVYDRDRIFDASTTTQPWVDCEKGVVHSASLLPQEEVRLRKSEPKVMAAPVQTTQQPSLPAYGTRPQTVPAWMPLQKNDGTKSLVIGIIAITTILLVTAITCGIFLLRKTKQSVATANEAITDTAGQNKGVQQKGNPGLVVTPPPVHGESADLDSSAITNTNNTAKPQANAKQNRENKKPESERAGCDPNAKPEKVDRENKNPQNHEASTLGDVKSVEDLAEKGDRIQDIAEKKNHLKTNETLKVFWYDRCGILTSSSAGLVKNPNRYVTTRIFEPDPGDLKKANNSSHFSFLIWYDITGKKAYWDWLPLYEKDPDTWFENADTIDLVDMCFGGTTNEVYKTWEKHCGAPLFSIHWTVDGKHIPMPPPREGLLKLEQLAAKYREQDKVRSPAKKDKSQGHLAEYVDQLNQVTAAKKEYEQHREKLDQQQKEMDSLKNKRKEEAKKKEISAEKKAIEKLFEKTKDTERKWNNIDNRNLSLWSKLEFNNHKIIGWEKLLENLNNQIEMVKNKEKQSLSNKEAEEENYMEHIRNIIRHSQFRIEKIERTKP